MILSDDTADLLLGHGPQGETKDRSTRGIGSDADLPSMSLDDGSRNRQPDPHAMSLGGEKRLKELRSSLRCDPGPGIGNTDGNHVFVVRGGRDHELALLAFLHG